MSDATPAHEVTREQLAFEDEVSTSKARRYVCKRCNSLVRARWHSPGSFSVGCDCQTVPVVPQMGQYETPDKWRVKRPECCRGVEASDPEALYAERADYECPDCGAQYNWDGEMIGEPEVGVDAE